MVTHHEKCIRRPVPIVGKNVKFPLNQMALDLFTARTAIRNIGHQGDIKSLSFFSFHICNRFAQNMSSPGDGYVFYISLVKNINI